MQRTIDRLEGKDVQAEEDNIDAFIDRARAGDQQAISQLNQAGVAGWETSTVYRYIGQSEVDALLSGQTILGKFGDGRVDVTSSTEPTTATSAEYRVTFNNSFDFGKNKKARMKNEQLGDGWIFDGYSLSDVATIERRKEDGTYEVVYNANAQTSSTVSSKPTLLDVVNLLYTKGKEVASKMFARSFFEVAQTPQFMKALGLRGDKFTIKYGVISRHLGKDNAHDLSLQNWIQLSEALQTPFAISKIKEKADSFRIYTTLQNEVGEYIVVGADVKSTGREIEVNAISTVFGRRDNANLTMNEEVIYRSENITPEQSSLLEQPNSAQYPTVQELSDNKITTNIPNGQTLEEENAFMFGNNSGYIGRSMSRKAAMDAADEATIRLDNLAVAREMEADFAERENRLEKLRNATPVEITGTEIEPSDDLKQYRKNALEYGKTLRGVYTNKDTSNDIIINLDSIKEVLHHDGSNLAHIQSIAAIPQMIQNGTYITSEPISNPSGRLKNAKFAHYYVCGLNIDGIPYTVKFVIAEFESGEKYYDHSLTQIEKGELLDRAELPSTVADSNSPISDIKDKRLLDIIQTNSKENARKIKLATGWERGADGKWRYEVPDVEVNQNAMFTFKDDGSAVTILSSLVNSEELFAAYPELEDMPVVFREMDPDMLGGYYDTLRQIHLSDVFLRRENPELNTKQEISGEDAIAHEIQHAIQDIEGFARGGSWELRRPDTDEHKHLREAVRGAISFVEFFQNSDIAQTIREAKKYNWAQWESIGPESQEILLEYLGRKRKVDYKDLREYLSRAFDMTFPRKYGKNGYRKFAGEVEARNVETRMNMTPEQRRASLASETQDVATEDQIFLFNHLGKQNMGSRVARRMADIEKQLQGRELTPTQQNVVDVYTGKGNNKTIAVERGGETHSIVMRQGNENSAGTKHSVYRHYHTGIGYITAEDILLIPEILANGNKTSGKRGHISTTEYTLVDNEGVKHSIITEYVDGREVFDNYYTNRKASLDTRKTRSEEARDSSNNAYSVDKDSANTSNYQMSERRGVGSSQDVTVDTDSVPLAIASQEVVEALSKKEAKERDELLTRIEEFSARLEKTDSNFDKVLLDIYKFMTSRKTLDALSYGLSDKGNESITRRILSAVRQVYKYKTLKGAKKAVERELRSLKDALLRKLSRKHLKEIINILNTGVYGYTPQGVKLGKRIDEETRQVFERLREAMSYEDNTVQYTATGRRKPKLWKLKALQDEDIQITFRLRTKDSDPSAGVMADINELIAQAAEGAKKMREVGPKNLIAKLRAWIRKFWSALKATFSQWTTKDIDSLTLREFKMMPLRDFIEGIDPMKHLNDVAYAETMAASIDATELEEIRAERKEIEARAKADGTWLKAPNGQPTNLTPEQWVTVRTRRFKEWFGDWLKTLRVEKLRNSEVVSISGQEFEITDDFKQNKKNALKYSQSFTGEYTNADAGATIAIYRGRQNGGVNEVLQHNYKDIPHIQSIAAIPQIIENSIYIESQPNNDVEKNPDVAEYQCYVCGLSIAGEDYTVLAKIVVDTKGNRYYDHNLTAIEKGAYWSKIVDKIVAID